MGAVNDHGDEMTVELDWPADLHGMDTIEDCVRAGGEFRPVEVEPNGGRIAR